MISNRFCKLLLPVLAWLTLMFAGVSVMGQHILFDTVYIDITPDTLLPLRNICVAKITDRRDEHSNFLRYVEEKKYLMVPADKEIYTRRPISEIIAEGLCDNNDVPRRYHIDIKKFEIIERKGKFGKSQYLVADLELYGIAEDTLEYLGTFYYDDVFLSDKKKETAEEQSTHMLEDWHRDFKLDLLTINATPADGKSDLSQNFISDPDVRSIYLNGRSSAFVGFNWWGFQAELFFSRPETQSSNRHTTGIIRYTSNTDYESFSIGRSAEHYYWRLNDSWLFDVDLNILFGFCRWRDIEIHNPKLQQLFDCSLSSAQSIQYNPRNKRGITFRAGLMESISYVIEKQPKLLLGAQLGIGVKL